ncbi:MAG: DUF3515 domain-containing protein [Nocardioidaceae bacterium]|nr:DUF3515 domain-containing protein [Nocardioidaceae bacterium]
MPRRPLLGSLTAAGLLLATASCGTPALELDPVTASPGTGDYCARLDEVLPAAVAGQPLRRVEPASAGHAWGDPAIVLRCGVAEPAALRPDSRLADVDGIGWFDQERQDAIVFTTVGREVDVEVTVPGDYAPEADALADLSSALERAGG